MSAQRLKGEPVLTKEEFLARPTIPAAACFGKRRQHALAGIVRRARAEQQRMCGAPTRLDDRSYRRSRQVERIMKNTHGNSPAQRLDFGRGEKNDTGGVSDKVQ